MKKKLQQLIAEGKTKKAIQLLLVNTEKLDEHKEVLLQSSRYETYEKNKNIGVLSFDEANISLAKINDALVDIIKKLPNEENVNNKLKEEKSPTINKETTNVENEKKTSTWKIVGAALLTAITVLAGIAEFSGYNLKDLFFNNEPDSFSVTVIVHGKKGKDDKILKNQGKVVLDIGADRKDEEINSQGEATFKELPKGYANQMSLISIDHPQPYFPVYRNREYKLTPNKVIYLEVELTGLSKIKGHVIDEETENPLDSVRVSVENGATLTDKFGWFELEIPKDIQAKFVSVYFFKEGYIMEHEDSIAPHTNQEIGKTLKKK